MQSMENDYFCALYTKFQAGANWLAKRREAGQDNTPHLAAFRRFEAQVDKEWENMAEEQKEAVLGFLAQNGSIPAEVLAAQEMFGGKLAEIT